MDRGMPEVLTQKGVNPAGERGRISFAHQPDKFRRVGGEATSPFCGTCGLSCQLEDSTEDSEGSCFLNVESSESSEPMESSAALAAVDGSGYSSLVAPHCAIGIGLPKHLCDESRSLPAGSAALSFALQVFGGSTCRRKPGRFSQEVPGRPTRRATALIGLSGGGCCKPHLLEATHG